MTIDVKLNMTSDTFNNTNDNTIAYNNTGDVKVQKVKKSNNSKRAEQIKVMIITLLLLLIILLSLS